MSPIPKRAVVSIAAVLVLWTMCATDEKRTGSVRAFIDTTCVPS